MTGVLPGTAEDTRKCTGRKCGHRDRCARYTGPWKRGVWYGKWDVYRLNETEPCEGLVEKTDG